LRWHIDGALNVGWQPSDVVDALLHAGAVTGSRAVDHGLDLAREVFAARALEYEFEPRTPTPEYRPTGLDEKTAATIAVAALTAVANAPARLQVEIVTALDAGATREEIVEVIEQMAVYAGFPAALNGLAAARAAFAR
jgi:4-carboxymuconolactone decarboxylase